MRLPGKPLALLALLALAAGGSRAQDAPSASSAWTLTGRVVDEGGSPLPGAGVVAGALSELWTEDALEDPAARTDGRGRFELAADIRQLAELGPGTFGLLVAAPGRASQLVYCQSLLYRALAPGARPAAVDVGTVTLPAGRDLFGRVRDDQGRPLAGVRVTASDLLAEFGAAVTQLESKGFSAARTGEDGIFRLRGVPPWGLRVVFRKAGYYRRTVVPASQGTPLQVELQPSGFVRGRVLGPEGQPLRALIAPQYRTIGAVPGNPWLLLPEPGQTDDEGRFRLAVELPGPVRVFARGTPEVEVASATSDWVAPGAEVEVRLQPPEGAPALRVEVRSRRDGKPVGLVRGGVLWQGFPDTTLTYLPLVVAYMRERGPRGGLLLPGPAPDETPQGVLFVEAPGFSPHVERITWTGPRDRSRERARRHRVVLDDPARIRGRVLDADGKPLAGVRVWAEPRTDSFLAGYTSGAWAMIRGCATGADGGFRLDDLAAGDWTVRAGLPGSPVRVSRQVELHREDLIEGLELRAPPVRPVALTLQGLQGHAGAWLELRAPDEVEGPFQPQAVEDPELRCLSRLDGEGRARVPALADGKWSLALILPAAGHRGPALRLPLPDLELAEGATEAVVDASAAAPATVTGTVRVQGAGVPRSRLAVLALQGEGTAFYGPFQGLLGPIAPLSAGGAFRLPVAPGPLRLVLLDLGTGAALAASPQLDPEPGKTFEQDLAAEVVELTVAVPKARDIWPDHVELSTRLEGLGDEDWLPTGFTSGAGRSLAEGESEVTLFVPRGKVLLQLRGAAAGLPPSLAHPAMFEVLGRLELDVQSLEPMRVTLRPDSDR